MSNFQHTQVEMWIWATKSWWLGVKQRFWKRIGICESCGEFKTREVRAMTRYHWDGKGEDPNRSQRLCERGAEEYRSYWQERWDEVNADIAESISSSGY